MLLAGWVLLAFSFPTQISSADPFADCTEDVGCQADSSPHSYCFDASFDTDLHSAATHAMETALEQDTQMSAQYHGTCATGVDVKWYESDIIFEETRGTWGCVTPPYPDPGDICWAGEIVLDKVKIDVGDDDEADRRKTACHEAGHSVGLEHGNYKTDCMINGEIPAPTGAWKTYNLHHINDHINPTY